MRKFIKLSILFCFLLGGNLQLISQSTWQLKTSLLPDSQLEMPQLFRYPLQAYVDVADSLKGIVKDFKFKVNGIEIPHQQNRAYARAPWTPETYGEYNIEISVNDTLGNDTTLFRTIEIVQADTHKVVRTLDRLLVNYPEPGRTRDTVCHFPQQVGTYDRIIAKMEVTCPPIEGRCDDWDRVAWIEIQAPDGQWYEIIRYITPFGKACNHQLDVTDFASILQGEVPMRVFVDTWGTGGWEFTLDFEYRKGLPQYIYTDVKKLWYGYHPFGDYLDLQPCDTLNIDIPANTDAMVVKIVSTGHGWGGSNTSNAAEFYRAKHSVNINQQSHIQDLWMQCNPNPDGCSRQAGTWTYPRAGWCPGAIAPGYNYNATQFVKDDKLVLSYIFDTTYVDQCHPNHPNCVSGVTCVNCDEGYNPHYYLASHLITYHQKMYDSIFEEDTTKIIPSRSEFSFEIYPNPAVNSFRVRVPETVTSGVLTISDISGKPIKSYPFRDVNQLNNRYFLTDELAEGVYFVKIQSQYLNGLSKLIIKK